MRGQFEHGASGAEGRSIRGSSGGVLHPAARPEIRRALGGPSHTTGYRPACRGNRCYAACEPRALVRASISLWLRPDYRFDRSRVSLEFTKGCKVRALRGLLSIDVTPMLKSAIAPELERVRREIDSRLPDVRADVERVWRQLRAPRELPLVGCVVISPIGLVQGPMQESRGTAHARFALLARPELRTDCSSSVSSAGAGLQLTATDMADTG